MDIHRHRVDGPVLGEQIDETLRHHARPALLLEQGVEALKLAGVGIVAEDFLAGVRLPGGGRLVGGQTSGKHCSGGRSASSGDRRVVEGEVRILLVEHFHQGVQRLSFPPSGPPAEDLYFLARGGALLLAAPSSAGRRHEPHHQRQDDSLSHHVPLLESPCPPSGAASLPLYVASPLSEIHAEVSAASNGSSW